jgi:hypothetical protein
LLEGNIIDNQGGIIMGAGEAAEADYLLSKLADIPKDGEYTLMIIR